jgi:hypothetical protein
MEEVLVLGTRYAEVEFVVGFLLCIARRFFSKFSDLPSMKINWPVS